jgi:hypothetical protein
MYRRIHVYNICMYEGCKPTCAKLLDNKLSLVSIFRLSILRVVCFYIYFMIICSFHGDGTGSILRSRRVGGKTLSVGDHDDAKFGIEGWIYTDSEETMHRKDIELRQATSEPFEPSSQPRRAISESYESRLSTRPRRRRPISTNKPSVIFLNKYFFDRHIYICVDYPEGALSVKFSSYIQF